MPEDTEVGIDITPYLKELREKISSSKELKEYTKEQLIYYLDQLTQFTQGVLNYKNLYNFVIHGKRSGELSVSSIATRHRMVQSLLSKLIEVLVDKKDVESVLSEISNLKYRLKVKFKGITTSERDWYLEVPEVKRLLNQLDGIKFDLCISYLYLGCRRQELVNLKIEMDSSMVVIYTAKSRKRWKDELKFRRFKVDERILKHIANVHDWWNNLKRKEYDQINKELEDVVVIARSKRVRQELPLYPNLLRHTFITHQRKVLHELRKEQKALEVTPLGFSYAIGWKPREKREPSQLVDIYSGEEELTYEDQANLIYTKYHWFEYFNVWEVV